MICRLSPTDKLNVTLGVGKELGVGGHGKVYKIRMPKGFFALKTFFDNTRFRENLSEEIQILQECENEHIVQYLGFCHIRELSSHPTVITELLDTDFQTYYMTENPSLECTVQILVQVAQGLEYLHHEHSCKKVIIHRDLTARNVLLSLTSSHLHYPLAKIADFGLSQFVAPVNSVITMTQFVASRYYYLAPEVINEKHKYNGKVDIFSFGHMALVSPIKHVIESLPDVRWIEKGTFRTEIERREEYFTLLQQLLKRKDHPYETLIKTCLDLEIDERPSAKDLVLRLTAIIRDHFSCCTVDPTIPPSNDHCVNIDSETSSISNKSPEDPYGYLN